MVNVSLATYTYCIHVRSILTKCFLEWSTLSLKKWLDHLGYQYLHDSRTSTEPQQTMSLATHLRQSSSTVSGPSYIDQKIEIRIKMSNVVRVAEQCFTRFICKRTPLQVQTWTMILCTLSLLFAAVFGCETTRRVFIEYEKWFHPRNIF